MAEAAVVAAPDPSCYGERVRAFVVLRPSAALSLNRHSCALFAISGRRPAPDTQNVLEIVDDLHADGHRQGRARTNLEDACTVQRRPVGRPSRQSGMRRPRLSPLLAQLQPIDLTSVNSSSPWWPHSRPMPLLLLNPPKTPAQCPPHRWARSADPARAGAAEGLVRWMVGNPPFALARRFPPGSDARR